MSAPDDLAALRAQIDRLQAQLEQQQAGPTTTPDRKRKTTARTTGSTIVPVAATEPRQPRGPGLGTALAKRGRAAAATTTSAATRARRTVTSAAHSSVNGTVATARRSRAAYVALRERRNDAAVRALRVQAMSDLSGLTSPAETRPIPLLTNRGRHMTGEDASGLLFHAWEPPVATRGPVMGQELHSHQPVRIDPFHSYQQGTNNPNLFVVGQQGYGKTMFLLLWIVRQVRDGRKAIIIDPKRTGGSGECAAVGRRLGWTVITFGSKDGARINLLDPRITTRSDDEDALTQASLLQAVAATALGRKLLPTELHALSAALNTVQDTYKAALTTWQDEGRKADRPLPPILSDLLRALFDPALDAATRVHRTQRELQDDGKHVAYMIDQLLQSDLGQTLDGQTTLANLDAPAIVFDVSQLPMNSETLPIVMTIINTFLHNAWWRNDGVNRILAIDEAAPLLRNLATVQALQASMKTSRGRGMSHVVAVQQTTNATAGTTDPTLSAAIQSCIDEAETVVAFRQDPNQARELAARRPLSAKAVSLLPGLPTGHALVVVGNRPPLEIRTNPTEIDLELMNSDTAMRQTHDQPDPPPWWTPGALEGIKP